MSRIEFALQDHGAIKVYQRTVVFGDTIPLNEGLTRALVMLRDAEIVNRVEVFGVYRNSLPSVEGLIHLLDKAFEHRRFTLSIR